MKRIAIIGASGFVGAAILKEALSKGYQVKAIVRNPEKITIKNPNLKVVKADVMDEGQLSTLLKGEDAVISAYNPGWKNPNIYDDTLKGYSSIIHAAKKAGVKRLQVVGGAGSLFVTPGQRLMDTGTMPENIMPGVKGLAQVLEKQLIPETQLDWIFFSPAGNLAPGKRTGKYRMGKDNLVMDEKGVSRISVEDYAMAMVNETEHPKHHRERFTIGY